LGIDLNTAQLLIRAHKSGVSFERMATLGRQRLLGDRHALISILNKSGYPVQEHRARRLLDPAEVYCEEFFNILGAKEIISIDVSTFEGAQVIHDMNLPIPDSLDSSFDVVLDGGTLEHIFDLATALRNAARMVRPNGRFISVTEANNFCGHGFYQFSPELYYRFLCPNNGYVMDSCILWEDIPGSPFYQVPDPDAVQDRINLTSEFGTFMLVQAQRQGDVSRDFIPQQSDYVRLWNERGGEPTPSDDSPDPLFKVKSTLKRIPALRNAVQSARAAARYRRLSVKRNVEGYLIPLKGLQAIR
jgi:SAM-dependent methyltransferase